MASDPCAFLPLKDLVFRILVALADGERHGWSLVQSLDEPSGGTRLLPGHLYRTLDRMLDDGLIDERDQAARPRKPAGTRGAAPSRFFRLTTLGRDVARAETRRLETLVQKARVGRLLRDRR
ncbi:MAG TPA: helix-turn-helix transcriptional regulator [Vicinamibacterales bacterium]|nr:helix-turn-helix transcriptional regulator [Vicinamibacterales bacterium]